MGSTSRKIIVLLVVITFLFASTGILTANADLLVTSGWENSGGTDPGDHGVWAWAGNPTVVTSPVHSGSYAVKFTTSQDYFFSNMAWHSAIPVVSMQLSAWVYFGNLPSTDGDEIFVLWIYDSQSNTGCLVGIDNVGGNVYWACHDNGAVNHVSSILVTMGVWHQVVLQAFTGHPLTYSAWIDGVQIENKRAGPGYTTNYLNYAIVGGWHSTESHLVYIDDVEADSEPFPYLILPEYAFGSLLAVAACFVGFAVFRMRKSTLKLVSPKMQ